MTKLENLSVNQLFHLYKNNVNLFYLPYCDKETKRNAYALRKSILQVLNAKLEEEYHK